MNQPKHPPLTCPFCGGKQFTIGRTAPQFRFLPNRIGVFSAWLMPHTKTLRCDSCGYLAFFTDIPNEKR